MGSSHVAWTTKDVRREMEAEEEHELAPRSVGAPRSSIRGPVALKKTGPCTARQKKRQLLLDQCRLLRVAAYRHEFRFWIATD